VRKIRIFTDRLKTQLADQLTERELVILDKIATVSKRMGNTTTLLSLYISRFHPSLAVKMESSITF